MRLSASFSEITARRGHSGFGSLIDFSFFMIRCILALIVGPVNVTVLATRKEPDLSIELS